MPSLGSFLDRLNEFFSSAPKGFDYGVEIRNPNYLTDDFFGFLKDKNISPVLIEGYYMPSIVEVAERNDISGGNRLVLRLMGRDRKGIEEKTNKKWDRVVSPQDEGLDSISDLIWEQVGKGRDVVVNVNNHYEGCAILTIDRLLERLKE